MEGDKIMIKLFILSKENIWEDKYTGALYLYEQVEKESGVKELKIILADSDDNDEIAYQFIVKSNIKFNINQDSVIIWEDGGIDYGLSFIDQEICNQVYFEIIKWTKLDINNESHESVDDNASNNDNIDLPDISLLNLNNIHNIFNESVDNVKNLDLLIGLFINKNALPPLIDLFSMCESIEDIESIYKINDIIKCLITTNRFKYLEYLLDEKYINNVLGILEYNRQYKERIHHRKILEESKNIQVIDTLDDKIQNSIIYIHKLEYLQNLLCPTNLCFEERTSYLSSFVFYRRSELIEAVFEDTRILPCILNILSEETGDTKIILALKFLVEICNFYKVLNIEQKTAIMTKFVELQIMEQLIKIKPFKETISLILEILVKLCDSHSDYVRKCLSSPLSSNLLLIELVEQVLKNPDSSTSNIAIQTLKYLLEVPLNLLTNQSSSPFMFLNHFYTEPATKLFQPIIEYCQDIQQNNEKFSKSLLIENLLDLLFTCIQYHSFHIKNFIFKHHLLKNIIAFINSKYTIVIHSFIKIVRYISLSIDEFYHQYIINEFIIDRILESFINKHNRDNLINSTILELFETLRLDTKSYLYIFIQRNIDNLQSLNHITTFRLLLNKYYKSIEPKRTNIIRFNTAAIVNSLRKSSIQNDDDDWFNDNVSDDDTTLDTTNTNTCATNSTTTTDNNINDCDLPQIKYKIEQDDGVILRKEPINQPSIKISLKRHSNINNHLNHNPLVHYSDDEDSDQSINTDYVSNTTNQDLLHDISKRPKNCT